MAQAQLPGVAAGHGHSNSDRTEALRGVTSGLAPNDAARGHLYTGTRMAKVLMPVVMPLTTTLPGLAEAEKYYLDNGGVQWPPGSG